MSEINNTSSRTEPVPAGKPSILITGANRGIGLELLKVFHNKGYRCFGGYRDADRASELLSLQKNASGDVIALRCDVTDAESLRNMAKVVAGKIDGLDILVNNAGVFNRGESSVQDVEVDALEHTLDVNLYGPLQTTQTFLPLLRSGMQKKLINISSIMGSVSLNTRPGSISYRVSKAALNQLVRSMAAELEKDGIVTLALHPGWAQTDMGGAQATLPVAESAVGLGNVIMDAQLESHNGRFLDFQGRELAW